MKEIHPLVIPLLIGESKLNKVSKPTRVMIIPVISNQRSAPIPPIGRTHSEPKRTDFFCRVRLFEDAVLEVRVRLEDLRTVFLRVVEALREDVFALLPVFFEVRFFLLAIVFNKFSCTISACLESDYSTNGLITNPISGRGLSH
jgi:hypothetical protein